MDASAIQLQREAALAKLAGAYERRELDVFAEVCRPDMRLTLAGESVLAGTYHGYEAFADYLETIRTVLSSADGRVEFEHPAMNVMVFHQIIVLRGPRHESEMRLDVTVTYHPDGRIQSFDAQTDDQGLFDHIIDTGLAAAG